MGRGRDKTIDGKDLANMSPAERAGLGNLAVMGRVKIKGAAVVRDRNGNARYDDKSLAGSYNEDKL